MQISDIIVVIDSEIAKLVQAKALLTGTSEVEEPVKRRGRPKGVSNHAITVSTAKAKTPTRKLSDEGKARIAAAQKARWATKKKTQKPLRKPSLVSANKAVKASAKKTARPRAAENRAEATTQTPSEATGI
jgi:hypothetical protein